MLRYIVVRLGLGLVTVVGMSVLIFLIMRTSGDPVDLYLPQTASVEQRQELRADLGLDRTLPEQYVRFAADAAVGDLGRSISYHLPVWELISEGLWASIRLTLVSVGIAAVVGVPIGALTASRRGSLLDRLGRGVALIGMSVPSFFLGIVLILVFAVRIRWFPPGGDDGWKSIVLPAVTLAAFPTAGFIKITRSAMLEVLNSDFVMLERLSGFSPHRITWKYALKNVLVPALSFLGLVLGPTVGGAVVVEGVFAWPGIGRLAVNAITQRDYPVIQGIVLVITGIVVAVNLVVDVLYRVIDPRLAHG
ncbi:MAG: ABC transporter permease [Ilumatobacteraceae bacterium]